MEHRPHPEQGDRCCLGLVRLARQYGRERLKAACPAQQAARQGFSMLNTRVTRPLQELQVAHADGSFGRRLAALAKLDLLVFDDLAIALIAPQERQDLLELLDDRVGSRGRLITSQLPTGASRQWLDEPTIADLHQEARAVQITTLSSKGQVIIPKALRAARRWGPGTWREVQDAPEGVLLRPAPRAST